jgi:hypothetical protein
MMTCILQSAFDVALVAVPLTIICWVASTWGWRS